MPYRYYETRLLNLFSYLIDWSIARSVIYFSFIPVPQQLIHTYPPVLLFMWYIVMIICFRISIRTKRLMTNNTTIQTKNKVGHKNTKLLKQTTTYAGHETINRSSALALASLLFNLKSRHSQYQLIAIKLKCILTNLSMPIPSSCCGRIMLNAGTPVFIVNTVLHASTLSTGSSRHC